MAIRALPADTSVDAYRVLVGIYRRMPASRRLELALQLSDAMVEVTAAGIRQQQPALGEVQTRRLAAARRLGSLAPLGGNDEGPAPMTQPPFFSILLDRLQAAGIAFMITGSYGSSHYGRPRSTNDLDVVIDPTAEQLLAFCASLPERTYVSREAAVDALRTRFMFNVIDYDSGQKVDLIIRKDRPFSVEEFRRRQPTTLYGQQVYVASAEDIILSKLEWHRLTPSERQQQDALDVAVVQWPQLDLPYLRQWALELGVAETLETILTQAAELDLSGGH